MVLLCRRGLGFFGGFVAIFVPDYPDMFLKVSSCQVLFLARSPRLGILVDDVFCFCFSRTQSSRSNRTVRTPHFPPRFLVRLFWPCIASVLVSFWGAIAWATHVYRVA